jgi:outer membrane receptor protein involved in Fe transport
VFGADWTYTPNSAWVNESRFSFNKFNEGIFPLDHNVPASAYGLDTGVTNPALFGFPRINPGLDNFNYMGGNSGWPLETTPSQTYNASDTVSYTAGRQTLRFGGQFMYGDVQYFRATEGRGRVDFSDLTDFVSGTPDRWEFLYGDPGRDVSMKSFGLFAQDGFRATRRLTLNFGLRYDVTFPSKIPATCWQTTCRRFPMGNRGELCRWDGESIRRMRPVITTFLRDLALLMTCSGMERRFCAAAAALFSNSRRSGRLCSAVAG